MTPRFLSRFINPTPARPVFNVAPQTDGSPAEIVLYGDVVEATPVDWWTGEPINGNFIALDAVLDALSTIADAEDVTVRLNSSGGDLFSGVAIHNMLKGMNARKTVIVEGLAASAASVIMCAADTVKVYPGSMVMVHNVASGLWGFYSTNDLKDVIRDHEACELSIKRIYAEKTGKSDDELQAMIDATTWLVGQDAVDAGFADEVIDGGPEMEVDGDFINVAGVRHSIAALGKLPGFIAGAKQDPTAHAVDDITERGEIAADTKEDELDIRNVADLRREFPEFIAEIEDQAVKNERERIRGIHEIANMIGDQELLATAMFDNSMTAAELALENTKRQAQTGRSFLNAMDEDSDESKCNEVETAPVNAEEDEEEAMREEDERREQAMLDTVLNIVKGVKND